MIILPPKKKRASIHAIAAAAFASATVVADVAYGAGDGSVLQTTELNDTTANGPILADGDLFGSSVTPIGDLNGDGVADLAVGSVGDDGADSNRGALHILFMNTDGSVDSTVEINDSTANGPSLLSGDLFGSTVASIGDLNEDGVTDIAVGAFSDDGVGSNRGALHILFMNTDGSVDSTVEINSATANGPTLSDNDFLGSSVTSIGDLNGDGVTDLAVGAYGDDYGGVNAGTLHILFMNTDGSVDSTVEINSATANGPSLAGGDLFGSSVTSIGDLNGDGVVDIVVGAKSDDLGASNTGALHILFMNTDGSVDSTAEINTNTANGPSLTSGDSFGSSVTSIGDLDEDGVTDLAVGAYGDDGTGSGLGAVHILFMNTDGSVDSTVEINRDTVYGPELSDNDFFGRSIASIGDLNGDEVEDIAVGAYGDNAGGDNRGAVHIMFMAPLPDTTSPTISTLSPSDNAANVVTTTNFTIEFDEVVEVQPGIITIHNSSDDSVVEEIDVTSEQVTGTGTDTITINPSVTLQEGTSYYVHIEAGALSDIVGNGFAGISDATTWNFTTVEPAEIPEITTTTPVDGATDISPTTPLTITFSVPMDTEFDALISASPCGESCPSFSISSWSEDDQTATLTNAGGTLAHGTTYTITLESAESAEGASIAEPLTWSFTTTAAVSEDVSEIDSTNRRPSRRRRFTTAATAPAAVQAQKAKTAVAQQFSSLVSTRDLELGSSGADVTLVQQFLIAQNKGPAAAALKAHGATAYFGMLTRAALAEWQAAHKITPALGYFGPKTKSLIKTLEL
jgi:hypothetical protein